MAFLFLKKIAEKILGTAAGRKTPGKKSKPQEQRKKSRSGARGARPAAKPRKGANSAKKTGAAAHPQKDAAKKSRRTSRVEGNRSGTGRGNSRPQENLGPTPVVTSGRSTAKPENAGERGSRHGRGQRRNGSDPNRRRPGGVISDEERAHLEEIHAKWSIDQFQVEPQEGKKRFHDFDLPPEVMHGIADLGFKYCSPIQALSLEHALRGKNVAGRAQTGTGKTAAFLVAILTRYLRTPEKRPERGGLPRTLVLAPTRELVIQISKDASALGKYCGLRMMAVYGGMDYERQKEEVLDGPVDLLVATPGRLLDFVRSRVIDLSHVDTLVIDEADRMLDMGFIPDVRSIIRRLPPKERRCTMLYSATLSGDVMNLASQWMEEPVRVDVGGEQVTTDSVKQIVYVVTAREKFKILYNHIRQYPESRILIFCNRKHTTEDVANGLVRRGIHCELLSGDVNQNRRLRVLEDFRSGKVRIVVATDVAGRGIHVDDIGFVINFDFPYESEDYVHRIGRTGRAGASGVAISFADEDESFIIPDIEKYIGGELKCTILKPDDPLLKPIPDRRRRQPRAAQPQETESKAATEKSSEDPKDSSKGGKTETASSDPEKAQSKEGPSTKAQDKKSEGQKPADTPRKAPPAEEGKEEEKLARRAPFIRPRNEPFIPKNARIAAVAKAVAARKSQVTERPSPAESKKETSAVKPAKSDRVSSRPHRQAHQPPLRKLQTGVIAEEWTPGEGR